MTSACISEIGKVIRGVSWDKADASDTARPNYVPILRAGNIGIGLNIKDDFVWVPALKVSAEQKIQAGDIAICMSSGSPSVVGKTALAESDWAGSVGAFCALVRANPKRCLPQYLAFFMKSPRFRQWTSEAQGANIKNIRKSALEDFEIWLPPLPEQRRIVDLLSRAESIGRLRREAERCAAQLIPALFLDLFGDPATNPKGWPVAKVADVLAEPPTLGTMTKPSSSSGKWLDLRVANIQGGQLTLNDKKWLDLPDEQTVRFALKHGDVVLARAIGSLDHLGKAVVVYPEGDWTFDSHLMRLRFDKSKLLPEVFKGFLESSRGRDAFLKHTRRSAVQFNINGKEVRQIEIPVPSLPVQHVYLEQVDDVHSIQSQQSAATAKAQANFDALLARCFDPAAANNIWGAA